MTMGEPTPHCSEHRVFVEACGTCRRARANHEPYPMRQDLPVPGAAAAELVTAESLKAGDEGFRYSNGLAVGSASRGAVKVLRKVLWPF